MSIQDATFGTVEHVGWLTPGIVRVVFGGDGLLGYLPDASSDSYVSLLLPRPGTKLDVPFDPREALRGPKEQRPVQRRFTVRRWDGARRELTIDFVTHGDVGVASQWAQTAQPGDRLQFRGPAGGYSPSPDADWHLLVGDESALPAIGASLERVPVGVPTLLFALVDGPGHELELHSPGDLRTVWVHRESGRAGGLLEAVRQAAFPAGKVHGFVHGEAGETRAIRTHLLADRQIDPSALSLSPYWRRSFDDEAWREVKADWLADQERDVA